MAPKKRGYWKPETNSEKILLLIAFIFILTTIFLTIGIILKTRSGQKICNSKTCVEAANDFLSRMDPGTEPCTDFYQYACGAFANQSSITDTFPQDNKFITLFLIIVAQIDKVVSKPWKRSEFAYYKKVKDLYISCMNETKLEERSSEPLLKLLDQVNGWPVVRGSAWNENDFDWRQTLVRFRSLGADMNHFFTLYVEPVNRNTSTNILVIDAQSLSIPSEYVQNEEQRRKYVNLMTDLAVLLGAERTRAEREMELVADFEKSITEANGSTDGSDDLLMSVFDLHELMPQISWVDFLNSLNFSTKITNYMEVKVTSKKHMKSISDLLSSTDKRIIANYMMWKVVLSKSPFLDDKFREPINKFYHHPGRIDLESNRKVYCNYVLTDLMNVAIAKIYIEHVLNAESKSMATEIANKIIYQFARNIKNAKWMDSTTLNSAKEKLRLMEIIIGYPEETFNDAQVDDFYSPVTISENTFFENVLELEKFAKDFMLAELTKKNEDLKPYHFHMSQLIHIYNHLVFNRIEMHAGVLEPPFFDPQWPNYLNYARTGSKFGGMLINGFDDDGKDYDHHGNNYTWWSSSTKEQFKEKTDSLKHQYIKFTGLEGTSKENVYLYRPFSTVHGMDLAYKAYTKWEKANNEELGLPGLSLNSRQLFWMAAVNIHCMKITETEEDRYSMKYKLISPLINSKDFNKDFNCPIGFAQSASTYLRVSLSQYEIKISCGDTLGILLVFEHNNKLPWPNVSMKRGLPKRGRSSNSNQFNHFHCKNIP